MEDLGSKLGCLNYRIKREFSKLPAIAQLDKFSCTNGFIIIYIYENGGNVFQKDIENHFGMTRSTVSKVIGLMEEKELIVRKSVEGDQRLKQLILTPKAVELSKQVINEKNEFESGLKKTLGEQYDSFVKSLDILNDYLGGGKKNV